MFKVFSQKQIIAFLLYALMLSCQADKIIPFEQVKIVLKFAPFVKQKMPNCSQL